MEKQEESKTYVLSEKQFGDVILQIGILKEMYDKIVEDRNLNLFQRKVLTSNKKQNATVLLEMEEIYNKSQ